MRSDQGELEWNVTFDWQHTGSEGSYRLFMQLGDGTLLPAWLGPAVVLPVGPDRQPISHEHVKGVSASQSPLTIAAGARQRSNQARSVSRWVAQAHSD